LLVGGEIAGNEQSRDAEIAYEAIAPVYDDFTAHHDYDAWTRDLEALAVRHGLAGRTLLDVACGTGKSFIPMLNRGWEVTASDISPAMVELARRKVGDAADLSVADMRELPDFGEFDLVWCLDDAVNYLLSGEELEQALSGMERNLGPGGLLMFDVNALEAYRTFFAEEVVIERDDRRLVWKGRSSPDFEPGSITEASFEVWPLQGGDGPLIAPEMHRQKHFPEAEVLAALESAGLECLEIFGHGEDAVLKQPFDDEVHHKAVYLARAAR
jgi:ubiquinone/menaquinone biosynthesis C-methylase UbiE